MIKLYIFNRGGPWVFNQQLVAEELFWTKLEFTLSFTKTHFLELEESRKNKICNTLFFEQENSYPAHNRILFDTSVLRRFFTDQTFSTLNSHSNYIETSCILYDSFKHIYNLLNEETPDMLRSFCCWFCEGQHTKSVHSLILTVHFQNWWNIIQNLENLIMDK